MCSSSGTSRSRRWGSDVLIRVRRPGQAGRVAHHGGQAVLARPVLGWSRPKIPIRGWDVAGRVEAVGSGVTDFRPGDEVLGEAQRGSFAELTVAPADKLVRKPSRISFEQAAAVPVSGTTAIQALQRQGAPAARAVGPGDRRRRRCGDVHGADRQGHGRDGDRRGEHAKARSPPARSAQTTWSTTRARASRTARGGGT